MFKIDTTEDNYNIYVLSDVSVWSIAVHFYELCCILTSPQGESKYQQRLKLQYSNEPKRTEEMNEIQEQTTNKDGLPNAGDRSSGNQKITCVMNDSGSYTEVDRNVENLT